MSSKKFAVYRHSKYGGRLSTQPVRRNGEPVTFRKKKEAKQWIEDELKAGKKPSTTSDAVEWVVRKYIKREDT